MEVLEIEAKEEVLKICVECDLSYYDSSYLYALQSLNEATKDEKLLETACGIPLLFRFSVSFSIIAIHSSFQKIAL